MLFPLLPGKPAAAFEVETHDELTRLAVERSELANGDLLASTLPEFWLGPEQRVDDKTVAEWIRFGAQKEDDPPWPVNHFHDPTLGWAFAGLFHAFHSSVFWQQLPGPSIVHHQWPQARDLYLRALLETDAGERDRLFKEMFRNIGHIVHLVQDAATPAHTRNDPHLDYDADSFHTWASVGANFAEVAGTSVSYSGELTPTSSSIAHRPVARIIDATEGDRGAPAFATEVGIAEYSNAQFLSDDRRFNSYPRPSRAAMEVVDETYRGVVLRRYLRFSENSNQGETDYYVAALTPLSRATPPQTQIYLPTVVDPTVLGGYGRKLVPRAIGYSITAIDHFFRGRIEISAPDRFAYGRAEYEEGNTSSFTTLRFKVKNVSPSGQEPGSPGQIWAVVHYRTSQSNLFEEPGSALSAEPVYAVSNPVPHTISRSPQEVRFDFGGAGIPANAADVWLIVVYQGDLGGEEDAVLVGGKDLPEPQPVDYANLTDYACRGDEVYYAAGLAPDDPVRDSQNLRGPYLEVDQYRRASSTPSIGSNPYDLHVPETRVEDGVTPMSRYVILRDADTDPDFQMFVEDAILDVDDVNIGPNAWGRCNLYAIRNDYNRGSIEHDVINPNQDLVTFRRFPTTASYRGWTGFNLQYLYETEGGFGWALGSGGFDSCLSSLESASPNLTYAPSELAPEE